MNAILPPRSIILFGGNAAGRVSGGGGGAVGQSFAIWVADRASGLASGVQAGSASGANDPLPATHQEMAENRGFRAMASRIVAGSAVAGSAKSTVFQAARATRRLITNLRNGARPAIEAGQLAAPIGWFRRGGLPLSNATPNLCPSRMARLAYGKSAARRPAAHCQPEAGASKRQPGLLGSGVRGFAYPKKTASALTGARRKSAALGRTGYGVAARLGAQGAGVHGVVDPFRAAQSAWVARGRNHVNAP